MLDFDYGIDFLIDDLHNIEATAVFWSSARCASAVHLSDSLSPRLQTQFLTSLFPPRPLCQDLFGCVRPDECPQRVVVLSVTLYQRPLHGLQSAHANVSQLPPKLSDVPSTLWAAHNDVGLIKNVEPVHITPKSHYRPFQTQYPLRKEAEVGIELRRESNGKRGEWRRESSGKTLMSAPSFPPLNLFRFYSNSKVWQYLYGTKSAKTTAKM